MKMRVLNAMRVNAQTDYRCPCCGVYLNTTKKFCRDERFKPKMRWLRCRSCLHWFLPITAKLNATVQAHFSKEEGVKGYSVAYNIWRAELVQAYCDYIGNVLDIGPGNGTFLAELNKAATRTGISADRSAKPIQPNITYVYADFMRGKIRRQYDLVTAWHVLEHVVDVKAALARQVALCRPGGIVAFELPLDRHLAIPSYSPPHPHRFSVKSVSSLLAPFRDKMEFLYLGAGFAQWSLLALGHVTRKHVPMPLVEFQEACAKAGKANWGREVLPALGEFAMVKPNPGDRTSRVWHQFFREKQ